eukprot:7989362-Pyramimonas_sp.AAC.1
MTKLARTRRRYWVPPPHGSEHVLQPCDDRPESGQGSAATATEDVHALCVAGLLDAHRPSSSTAPVRLSTQLAARVASWESQSHLAHEPTCVTEK